MSAGNNECITVVVRCRPMNKKEHDEHRKSIIDVDAENRQVGIRNPDTPNEPPKYFTYDATYDEKTQQKFFYEESCFNVIESTLEGFNSTIFAYGQTGCGKSFTMQGPSTTDENLRGVTPNSFSHIFQFVKTTKNIEFLIRCSYLELYNEEIRDLLIDPKLATKCELKEDPNKGIYVKGLTDVVVESPEDLHKMLDKGVSNRTTAATLMNSESSRSHSIFTIIVEMNTKDEMTGKDMLRVGKLNLVDLAGSERAKKTGATDKTLKEGIRINLSLSVLGNVISALADGGKFIPYRDSKLTRLLQDSLGGNTKTMMVAAISPADYNYDETLSTLRYANRAKNIKNKPKINEDPKDTMIREFKSEIERLRKLLAEQTNAASLLAQLDPTVLASAGAGGAKPAQTIQQPTVQHHPQPPALAVIEEVRSTPNSPQKVSRIIPSEQTTVGGSDSSTGVLQQESFVLGNVGSPSSVTTMNLNRDASNYTEEIVNEVISPTKSNSNNPMVNNVEVITTPRDMEQQIRGEIENRLHQLEHMLVNSEEVTITASPQKEITVKTNNAAGNIGPAISTSSGSGKDPSSSRANSAPVVPLLQFTKTPEQIAEEERQIQQYKERKLLAKKRREEKQQREILKVLEEKNQIAQELEELKQNLLAEKQQQQQQQQRPPSSTPQQIMNNHEDELDEFATRKLQKLKKRYEKKLTSVKEELDDLRDDFYYQRKQLMDAMLEQEKNCKLYEIICKSLIGERDVKKILEKCTYDDEKDEWIVPFIKRKNYDIDKLTNGVGQGEGYYSSNNNSGGGGGGGLFPDIYNPKDPGGAAANMNINGKSPLEQKFSSLQTGSWALNAPIETTDDNRRPVSQSRRVRSARANGNNTSEPQYSSIDSVSNYAGTKIPMVPLLTLPGSLVPASSLISPKPDSSTHHTGRNQANSTSSARADEYQNTNHVHNFTVAPTSNVVSLPGIGFNDSPSNNSNEERSKVKTASKNKNKLPKATPNQSIHNTNNNNAAAAAAGRIEESSSNRMPSINSHQNHYNTNNNINNSNNNTVSNQQLNYSTNAISNSYQQATDYSNVDEMGTGETAGPLHDWGFANPDPSITTTNHGKHKSKGHNYDLTPEEYNYENGLTAVNENYPNNNNYQFVSNTSNGKHSSHGTKKKKKSMENGNTLPATINGGSMFPPIENKHATPRGGGGGLSLPPI